MIEGFDFHAIEREAKRQAAEGAETTLGFGQHIAWATTTRVGVTVGLSSLHRVGLPIGNVAHTSCGHAIPAPVLWLPLSPALPLALLPCGFCEAAHAEESDHRSGMAA